MNDRVGQRLGNYHLIRLLGKGGFAEVYLGEHVRLNTQAAIKVLLTRLAGDNEIASFQKEAKIIAHLKHPHIIHVLDFDVVEDTPFLVMDYAPGGTLRQRHPKGTQLTPETILPYVQQAAAALYYAHERKLIHRDIKPENLLVGEDGQILLSDFGIALISQSSRYQNPQDQGVMGTAAYMAPEQFKGAPQRASDQYALAVVIYEWLTGTRPFKGNDYLELGYQHVHEPPPPLRVYLPTLSQGLENVVLTALKKDPGSRFSNMRAFATAFETACQESGLLDAPTGASQPTLTPIPSAPITPKPSQPMLLPSSVMPPTIVVPLSNRPSGDITRPSVPFHVVAPQHAPQPTPTTKGMHDLERRTSRRKVVMAGGVQ